MCVQKLVWRRGFMTNGRKNIKCVPKQNRCIKLSIGLFSHLMTCHPYNMEDYYYNLSLDQYMELASLKLDFLDYSFVQQSW